MSFDVLQDKIIETQNPTVAGLDARIEYVPEHIRKACYEQYVITDPAAGTELVPVRRGPGGEAPGGLL